MRILHTSDWHLGRSLHGVDLHQAQREFIDQIEQIVRAQDVDAVLIAGDVFDRAVPPVESVELFSDALARLVEHCQVVVIAGNHDSATRLGFGSRLHRDEIHVVTSANSVGEAIELWADDECVLVYPIPFLDPDAVRGVLSDTEEPLSRSHEAVMNAAVARINKDRDARGQAGIRYPAVVAAHAFVVGGQASDSERDIRVGGVDSIAVEVFAGFDYVALGHLHGPQLMAVPAGAAAVGVVEYSGSPLRYSFSEAQQAKSVTIIDVAPAGAVATTRVPIAQPRAMTRLSGSLADILSEANIASHADAWVQAIVTDPDRPPQLHEHIRTAFPHAISIEHRPALANVTASAVQQALDSADPLTVCSEFFLAVTAAEPTAAEVAVFANAYEAVRERGEH